MNVAMRKPMSLAEFLTWKIRQELRYEFDGFQPIAMTDETALHSYSKSRSPAVSATRTPS